MREYCVYMLRCSDATFYVGVTSDLPGRIAKHKEGWDAKCYTFARRPLECVLVERYSEVRNAIAREKQLKQWSRKKKEALIAGDEDALQEYSESGYAKRVRLIRVMVRRAHHDTLGDALNV